MKITVITVSKLHVSVPHEYLKSHGRTYRYYPMLFCYPRRHEDGFSFSQLPEVVKEVFRTRTGCNANGILVEFIFSMAKTNVGV